MPLPVFIRGGQLVDGWGGEERAVAPSGGNTKNIDYLVLCVSMPRSKLLHFVNIDVNIEQPNEADGNWASGVIQVDTLLSKKLGRTIRNGNAFRLVGYGASLRGFTGSSDQDVGFAGVASLAYCPVTAHSVGAHQKLFKAWNRQKRLKSGVGEFVRYDDFECGWTPQSPLEVARRSALHMEGIGDSNGTETVSIYGASVAGASVTLEEFYNNLNPVNPSSSAYAGGTIKQPKFDFHFPPQVVLSAPATFSSTVDVASTPDTLAGQVATGDMQFLPADNHISHLTGTLYYFFKGVAGDTAVQAADELKLTITLAYEGWSPLNTASAMAPKRSGRKTMAKKTSRKANKRRS